MSAHARLALFASNCFFLGASVYAGWMWPAIVNAIAVVLYLVSAPRSGSAGTDA